MRIDEKMKLYESDISISERELLPLNGPGNYRVKDGVIWTRAIEINAVRHCNLSCRGCSHSSPLEGYFVLQPNEIASSLRKLSRFLKAETIRVVGGEPLLHPNLSLLLCAVRESRIAEQICLVTNGILLDQIDEEILSCFDEIQISLYPLSEQIVSRIYKNVERVSKICEKVKVLKYSFFREAITNDMTENQTLCNRIYETCQIAHYWRCMTVEQGFLYRCPQSMVLMRKYDQKEEMNDKLEIKSIKKMEDVLCFLENNNSLRACASCLGSVGTVFEHEQVHKDLWVSRLPTIPEEGVDYNFMDELEKNARADNDCMKIYKRRRESNEKVNEEYFAGIKAV